MTRLEHLKIQMKGVEQALANAQSTVTHTRNAVALAEKEHEEAGRPQNASHPAYKNIGAARSAHDSALMEYNDHFRAFQKLRGDVMQEQTNAYGSVDAEPMQAPVSPAPDPEFVAENHARLEREAAERLANANPSPDKPVEAEETHDGVDTNDDLDDAEEATSDAEDAADEAAEQTLHPKPKKDNKKKK